MASADPDFNAPESSQTSANPMLSLPRVSMLMVLVLSLASFGVYSTYWLYTRTQIINQVHNKPISMHIAHTVMGLLMLNILLSLISVNNPENLAYQEVAATSGLIFSLVNLYWVFTVRQRIHRMAKAGEQSLFWLNGLWTLLAQVLYLQYKINEYLDQNIADSSLAV